MAPLFVYQARTRSGKRVGGTVRSGDIHRAVDKLRNRGYLITRIRAQGEGLGLSKLCLTRGSSSKELALFCRQTATMLSAGIALDKALQILAGQQFNTRLGRAVDEVRGDLVDGSQLAEAMARQPLIFPDLLIHMVAAGETGGNLEELLARAADQFEKEHRLGEKVKGALTYPGVITMIAIAAVIFLLTIVLPTFTDLFTGSGLTLPWPTRILLAVGEFIAGKWYLLGGGGLLSLLGTARFFRSEGGRKLRDRILLAVPVLGPALQQVGLARFCRTLGTLLSGGISLLSALDVVNNTTGNLVLTRRLEQLQKEIRTGRNMADLLRDDPFFPGMMVEMVGVGEETGSLPVQLIRIADYYEQEVDYVLARLASLLEPILILAVACLVGFIVLSIMLPLLDLMTVVG